MRAQPPNDKQASTELHHKQPKTTRHTSREGQYACFLTRQLTTTLSRHGTCTNPITLIYTGTRYLEANGGNTFGATHSRSRLPCCLLATNAPNHPHRKIPTQQPVWLENHRPGWLPTPALGANLAPNWADDTPQYLRSGKQTVKKLQFEAIAAHL